MRFGLSFAVSNVFIRPRKVFYPQNNFLYSINLIFSIFIMVDKLFSEKHTKAIRPPMRTFDTAKESLDPYFHLNKRIKWSLKCNLSISQYEVTHEMTPKSRKVKTSIDNKHLIYLSDHLSGLLKWKYGVRAF